MQKLIWLELNEVNFEFVERYIRLGQLPNFASLLDQFGYAITTSETEYEHIEPWIQWATAHTGKTFAEHQLFRLGDIENSNVAQVWDVLEDQFGCKVAAISPMNATNRTSHSPFFLPDPWTHGRISGPRQMEKLYSSISRIVNTNADGDVGIGDAAQLILGLITYGRLQSYPQYLSYLVGSVRGKWRQAMLLDRLLADLFIKCWQRHQPDFSTLFVNAAAHIQHHYLFNSAAYEGKARNPEWYVSAKLDPVLEVYELYDRLLGEILVLPDVRIMLVTGLHQDPHDETTYYYRLSAHEEFLDKIGVEHASVLPRMSRDFLVRFDSIEATIRGEEIIAACESEDGDRLFSVDNRGKELFCMLTYSKLIGDGFRYVINGKVFDGFARDVAFVAIKNGRHNNIGYFVDTGWKEKSIGDKYQLTELYDITLAVMGANVRLQTNGTDVAPG